MFTSAQDVQFAELEIVEPAVVVGDAFAIRQIVDNLVSNAIKFSKKNVMVEVAFKIDNGRVRLLFKDCGYGISIGRENRVFGRFEQVENGGRSSTQGSGLGLHISKKLAKEMLGDLFYEGGVGVGSTFHVEFQLTDEKLPAQSAPTSTPEMSLVTS
jgi:signal transduction histidine kinase